MENLRYEKVDIDEQKNKLQLLAMNNIFKNIEKLTIIKKLLKKIEQPYLSLNIIKKAFLESKDLLKEFVVELQQINTFTMYTNQIFNEFHRSDLKSTDDFYPVFSTGNGNCFYNSQSYFLEMNIFSF